MSRSWSPFVVALGFVAAAAAAEGRVEGGVPRDGFVLHYRVAGEAGPYVVVLAGGPGLDVDYMESLVPELSRAHRVVLLEQRGTGRSRLPVVDATTLGWDDYLGDLEALREALGEERLTLLGHSWGMTYALAYAAEHPGRTRGVVTLGSAPVTEEFLRLFDDNRRSRLHPAERERLDHWSAPERWAADPDRALLEYLRAITPTDFFDRAQGLAQAERWRPEWCHARIGEVTVETIWNQLDLRPRLGRITAPVLFVHGYQDVAGEANVLEAAARIPRATVRFLHRCGHYPWLEQPAETWAAVLPFLGALEP